MNKLLTIAIPTFNRPHFLDEQLSWLARAIEGFESDCEIIISDDGSTDNTQDILEKWRSSFSNTTFKLSINSENCGPVKNITQCLKMATSKYVWVVGDDDELKDTTVAYVLNNLKENPDLGVLILNYSIYYVPVERLVCERYFDIEDERVRSDGKEMLERIVEEKKAANGIGFITTLVFRTDLVQQSIERWSDSASNFEAPVYWTGFCGLHGSVKISKDIYVQYNCGMNSKPTDKQWFRHNYFDLPTVYVKLAQIGYSEKLFRELILTHFKQSNLRVILGSLRRWPIMTVNTMVPYLGVVGVSTWKSLFSHQYKEAHS